MGNVKLTPRQTASLLNKLDTSARSVNEARAQLFNAMADRQRTSDGDTPPPRPVRGTRKKR
jgi:hypothetical protein